MQFEPVTRLLKDGRTALFRSGRREDAEGLLTFLRTVTAETPYLLRTPEEVEQMTAEGEAAWIEGGLRDPNTLMLLCEVEGEIAGNCEIAFGALQKKRHTAVLAIGLKKKFWGLGIGTHMFTLLEEAARQREGCRLLELEFIGGNSRARGLYEKMGFRITGLRPDTILQEDGTLAAEYIMQKTL